MGKSRFLSGMGFMPIGRVYSNSTGAGVSEGAGWPENGREGLLRAGRGATFLRSGGRRNEALTES
jgi:hypothetical protein